LEGTWVSHEEEEHPCKEKKKTIFGAALFQKIKRGKKRGDCPRRVGEPGNTPLAAARGKKESES